MQEIFLNKRQNDNFCVEKLGISNTILMENAGLNLANFIHKKCKKLKKDSINIIFLCGSGDNGADGLVAARILDSIISLKNIKIYIILLKEPKSDLCKMQFKILQNLINSTQNTHLRIIEYYHFFSKEQTNKDFLRFKLKSLIKNSNFIIDCIFGSGFDNTKKGLQEYENYQLLKEILKNNNAIKIACDMPSGLPSVLGHDNDLDDILCPMDYTLSMGAFNLSLLDSRLKDIAGRLKLANLGINKTYYDLVSKDMKSRFYLLQKADLKLPKRDKQDSNKGSFGSAYIFCGNMFGASLLAARAAFSFGVGKSIIYTGLAEPINHDCEIIYTDKLPKFSIDSKNLARNAFAIGMGLGFNSKEYKKIFNFIESNLEAHYIFDADIFYQKDFIAFLSKIKNVVLTPHPKEFLSLLQLCEILDSKANLDFVLKNIFKLSLEFSNKFPHIVCLIKGANTTIVYQNNLYINNLGSNSLAKGGSGDVLSGLIVSLLAQGFSPLNACCNASIAHSLGAKKLDKKINNYSLTPLKLIESITKIKDKK